MSESILVKIFESLYAGGDLEFKKMLVLWSLYYDLVREAAKKVSTNKALTSPTPSSVVVIGFFFRF